MMRPVHVVLLTLIVGLSTITTLTLTEGCGSVKPVVTDVIDCAKTEATIISDGFSIVQVVAKVWAALQSGPTAVITEIEKLVAQYGGDIIACAIDNYPEPVAVAGGTAGSAVVLSTAQDVLNKRMVLSTLFAGKKINHTFRKP